MTTFTIQVLVDKELVTRIIQFILGTAIIIVDTYIFKTERYKQEISDRDLPEFAAGVVILFILGFLCILSSFGLIPNE